MRITVLIIVAFASTIVISIAGCSSADHSAAPAPTATPTPQAPRVGNVAPDFALDTLDGTQKVHLSDFQGKAVLLYFWATTCSPCVKELSVIQRFYAQQQAAHQSAVVLAVDIDRVGDFVKVSALQQQLGLEYPLLVDDHFQARMRYQVSDVPVAYFVDRHHIIRSMVSGVLDDAMLSKLS